MDTMVSGGTGHFTNSQQALDYLQSKYGSANYSSWQALRKEWYSFVNYGTSGQTELLFFGDVPGQTGITRQDTNLNKAGSFGQTHFLLKSIRMAIRVADWEYNDTVANDADTIYSDIVAGFVQDGVVELRIGGRIYSQIPVPFMFAPPANGQPKIHRAGLTSLTLTEGTPNTLASLVQKPFARLTGGRQHQYLIDPNVLIEAEQTFDVTLLYSNAVSIIATDVHNASTNPVQVGCYMSGITFRPVQ